MLKSTFPAFKSKEAERELISSGGGGMSGDVSPTTTPIFRSSNGLLAGWITPPPPFSQRAYVNTATTLTATAAAAVNTGPNGTIPSARYSTTAGENPAPTRASRQVAGSAPTLTNSSATAIGDKVGDFFIPGKVTPDGSRCGQPSLGVPSFTVSIDVCRGDVVAIERPLFALQGSQALPWVVACPGCLRHVGTLEVQLAIASGEVSRAEAFLSVGGEGTMPLPPLATPVPPGPALQPEEDGREERKAEGLNDDGEGVGRVEGEGTRNKEGQLEGDEEGEGERRGVAGGHCAGLSKTRCGVNSSGGERGSCAGRGVLPPLPGLSGRFVEVRGNFRLFR